MSTGIGTGIAGDVFKAQTSAGSGIVPIPAVLTNEYSMYFDGVNEYLKVVQVPLLGSGGTGNWSISFWLKMVNTSGVSNQRLFAFGTGGTLQTQFYISNTGTIQLQGPWSDAGPLNSYSAADTWIHVIYRVDRSTDGIAAGNNVGYAFNGGNFNNKSQTSFPTFDQTGSCFMGRNAGSYNFNGNIDEVAIWNKYLTDEECAAVYNGGTSVDLYSLGISSNLQHWWRMGDPIGPTEYPIIPDQVTGGIDTNVVVNGTFDERGIEQVDNGNFTQTGSELVTNGDFAIEGDWSGAASINTVTQQLTKTGVGLAYQTGVVSSTRRYQVTVDVASLGGTAAQIYAGGAISEDLTLGLQTIYITGEAVDNNIGVSDGYLGGLGIAINSISVKEIGYSWTAEGTWGIDTGLARRTPALATDTELKQTFTTANSKPWAVSFEITEISAGGCGMRLNGGSIVSYYPTIGVKSQIITGSGTATDVIIQANTTFVGAVTNVSVKEVSGNWFFVEGSGASVMFEEGVGYNGTTGCVFTGNASNTLISLNQDSILTPGRFYELSFVAKRNPVSAGSNYSLALASSTTVDVFEITSTTYQEYSVRFEANSADLVLRREDLTKTSVIVDNIVIREITGYAAEMINMDSTNIEADAP